MVGLLIGLECVGYVSDMTDKMPGVKGEAPELTEKIFDQVLRTPHHPQFG